MSYIHSSENEHVSWKMLVGKQLSFWNSTFSGDIRSFSGVGVLTYVWQNTQEPHKTQPKLQKNFNTSVQGGFNTTLGHTPKPLPTGYKGIPFIVL